MSGGIVGVGAPDPGTSQLINRLANPPNPLEQAGQSINALGAIKEFAAQNALTGIYQQSIDPATGQVDLNKFNALASQNPAALWKFGETMRSAGAGVGAQGQGTSAAVNAQLDQLAVQQAYMSPLLPKAQAGTLTADDVRTALKNIPPGVINPTTMANINQQLDSGANPSQMVLGGYFASQHARDMASMTQPSLGTIQSGSMQYPTQGNSFYPGGPGRAGGIQYPAAPFTQGTQPGGTDIEIGNGQKITVPNDQVHTILTNNPNLQKLNPSLVAPAPAAAQPPPASGSAPGAAVTNNSFAPHAAPGRAGRYPGEVAPPPATTGGEGGGGGGGTTAAPAPGGGGGGGGGAEKTTAPLWLQPPTPVSPAAGGGGVGVTPAPWYAANVAKITGPAIDAENTFASQVSATKDIEPILKDMQSQLNVPGIDTGVGYTAVNSVRQLAEKFGVIPSEGQGSSEAMRAQDEFNKDSARLVAAQSGAMGNPTDARTEVAASANPGAMQSTYGNKGIVQMLIGNQQALRAEADAWQKAKGGAGWTAGGDENNNFNTWRTDRFLAPDPNPGPAQGGRFDQRVFWMANAPTLDEQRTFAQKIPAGPARAQFVKNLNYAAAQGWIKTDDKGLTTPASP